MNEAVVQAVPLVATDHVEGFAALYERTFPRVYAYVASLLRDRSAAEDVTALAFERAYRKRRSYRPARGARRAAPAQAPHGARGRPGGHRRAHPRGPRGARGSARDRACRPGNA